jgi:hypothetical protein
MYSLFPLRDRFEHTGVDRSIAAAGCTAQNEVLLVDSVVGHVSISLRYREECCFQLKRPTNPGFGKSLTWVGSLANYLARTPMLTPVLERYTFSKHLSYVKMTRCTHTLSTVHRLNPDFFGENSLPHRKSKCLSYKGVLFEGEQPGTFSVSEASLLPRPTPSDRKTHSVSLCSLFQNGGPLVARTR